MQGYTIKSKKKKNLFNNTDDKKKCYTLRELYTEEVIQIPSFQSIANIYDKEIKTISKSLFCPSYKIYWKKELYKIENT